jgi:hypothetical protein
LVVPVAPSPLAPPAALQVNDLMLSRLAHELARDIHPLETVLQQFKIDPDYFGQHIIDHPLFKQKFMEATALWQGSNKAKERASTKAALLFEEWLPEADRLFHDTQQPMSAKIEAMKLLAKIGQLDQSDSKGVAAGERVVVNINLSAANAPSIVIDKMAEPKTIEGTVERIDPTP